MEIQDKMCYLCGHEEESNTHLFFKCSTVRAIWFGCNWSLRSDEININNSEEIVKFTLEPPLPKPHAVEDLDNLMVQQSIKIVLTLEAIWSLRNKIAHHNEKVNILTFIKCLNL